MHRDGASSFATAIGRCAVAWRGGLCVRVFLPGAEDFGSHPAPAPVAELIARLVEAADGRRADFADAPLDWSGVAAFRREVYRLCAAIPTGQTRTYGALAADLGDKALSRAVGAALGANPFPVIVPCHRVIAAGGKWGGFSAPEGLAAKKRLLAIEGALGSGALPLFGG